jgi:hypothetical protein
MRYLFFSAIIITTLLAGCINNDVKTSKTASVLTDSVNFTTIEWLDSTKDFGKINEGEKIPVSFRFKNSGTKPLVIREAHASCGCTVVDKPEKPFAPGEQGEIKAIYNSEGHEGVQNKTITVSTNTPDTKELKFSLEVVKKS